ncbi:hypothetical protein F2A38_17175 [Pseudomonas chlororaphis]|uniref:Uncharacterized protein n=1 Tax=Pseudomonas chlororaphis TaxID=587753 RepID=A0AB34C3V7_9PSED|nr:hypothetical protein [Pseudomonas chlororaphis]KAA5841214.1 hypothetical protein F2A38_17175 [Pseudomonas chlororaphis]
METAITLLKSLFDSVPPVIWTGLFMIISAALAFIAANISNNGNNTRLAAQLKHDTEHKDIDRMNLIRREVYLEAIAEFPKASAYLASLSVEDTIGKDISQGLNGLFAAAAKLSLVTPPKTQQLVEELGERFTQLLFNVIQQLLPIQELTAEIKINSDLYDQYQAHIQRVLSKTNDFNESASSEDQKFRALQNSFEFFSGEADKYGRAREAAQAKHLDAINEFRKQFMLEMQHITPIQTELIIALREDLRIETDAVRMRESTAKLLPKLSNMVDTAVTNILK